MKQNRQFAFLFNPKFQVITTYLWNFVGVFLIGLIAFVVLPTNLIIDPQAMIDDPNLALIPIFSEIVLVGLLPILFTIISKDNVSLYGLSKKGLVKGIVLSAPVVVAYYIF